MGLDGERFNKTLPLFNELLILSISDANGVGIEIMGNYVKLTASGHNYSITRLVVGNEGTCTNTATLALSICYDDFYQVPRLFFRIGDGKGPLSIENCPSILGSIKQGIIQDTHTITNEPWYSIHPCETNEFMDVMMGSVDDLTYLKCWFGVYGIGEVFTNISYRPLP